MKFSFLTLIAASVVLLGLTACKKKNFAVDKDPLIVQQMSEFALYNPPFARTFYVGAAAPDNVYNIPVGLTSVSNVDRTIQLTYSSATAVAGTHYTAPATVTVPAGQAVVNLPITGIFANIPAGVAHVLKIKITGGDVPVFSGIGKDSVMLTMRRYCPVVLTTLAGAYSNTNEYTTAGAFSYGPYTTQLTNVVSTGPTTATATIVNLYDDGWVNLTGVVLDWTDPANFKVTIPYQTTGKIYSGTAPTFVRTSTAAAAVNTFSSCDRSLSFGIDLVNSGTGAVITSNYKFVMK